MIKICTPYYDKLPSHIKRMRKKFLKSGKYDWITAGGCYINNNRNACINMKLSDEEYQRLPGNFTHYLMLDSDIKATEKDIDFLVNLDLPIVSGAYESRVRRGYATCGLWKNVSGTVQYNFPMKSGGLKKVHWSGMGFCLIKKEVLDKMQYPWFEPFTLEIKRGGRLLRKIVQDDIAFCMKAETLGIPVYTHFNCKVSHLWMK